ncbi:hypothetical protein RNE34_003456 [Vibrio cholerae]|nr:hypothetical protein [Vibrio cholerae]EGR0786705.1 hypothetical protein [Vibrio cholerae]EGR0836812.1 hypothetical protein [Vibrio cholerae]EGR0845261.1 hypothetical protein [Vibrio cholerae]EGR0862650.1 hypothetical protein [Vibrio cholerae]
MKLRRELGFYVPAFFMLKVDTNESINNVLNSAHERILSHELIHFLQDLTTTYGLINISRCVDVVKDQNQIALNGGRYLDVPIPISLYSPAVAANTDLFSCYIGDDASQYEEFPRSVSIISVNEDLMDIDNVDCQIKVIEVEYGSPIFTYSKKFYFGAMAICESMAHLIECEIYGVESEINNFPYNSATMLTEFLCPHLKNNNQAVSEICEASLMYYNPAEVFVMALNKINEDKVVLDGSNDYYLYVVNNFTLESNSVEKEYNSIANSSISQLNDLFTVEPLKSEQWASNLVVKARGLRNTNISITSRLWQGDRDFKRASLMHIIRNIGFPVAFNNNDEVWIDNSDKTLNTPLMFPAIMSINEIFMAKRAQCYLYEHCKKHGGYQVGDECMTNPWVRAKNGSVCYFSNMWKMWGLEKISINIK